MARMTMGPIRQFRGTHAQVASYLGPSGEVVVDTDQRRLVVQDGETTGGVPVARLDEIPGEGTGYAKVESAYVILDEDIAEGTVMDTGVEYKPGQLLVYYEGVKCIRGEQYTEFTEPSGNTQVTIFFEGDKDSTIEFVAIS